MKQTLASRMKEYEGASRTRLLRRVPVIIRVDGKSFHTFCNSMKRPFDERLIECMWAAAKHLCRNVQGCQLAYVQSDEISLLLTDWDRFETQSWFDYRVQKMASVAAGLATVCFFQSYLEWFGPKYSLRMPCFDARVANYPRHDVANYFVWRQLDWIRNSVHMVGRAHFSAKELHNCHSGMVQEMLLEKGVSWTDLPGHLKHGACIVRESTVVDEVERWKWVVDKNLPLFTENRRYIERYMTEAFCKEEL